MRRLALLSILVLLALNAFGHAGEVHTYMGTVEAVNDDGSFQLRKTDGEVLRVSVTKSTAFVYTDGSAAPRTALAAGKRIVVTLATDAKTATTLKFAKK